MGTPIRVLIVEDSENDAELVLREIQRGEYDIEWERVETRAALEDALGRRQWDIVICDHSLPEFNAIAALETLHARGLDLPFIIISGSISEEAAVQSLKAGAHDFIVKGKLARLIPAVERELKDAKIRQERKQAEERLRLSDQILQRVNALVIVADSQGEIVYVSPAVKTILGYEPDELLGDNWWKVSRPEPMQAQREKEYLAKAARGEIPVTAEAYERALQDRSGNTHWILWVDAAGPGDLVIGVGHDITERKLSADQLKYHARLLKHINDAVIATDDKLRITAWNRAAEKMFGWSSQAVIGRNISEILSSELTEEQRAEARELLKGSSTAREQRIYQRRDGRILYVEANTIAITDEQNKFTGFVSVNRDITERKQAEEELHKSEERYRFLFENNPLSMWVYDLKTLAFLAVNDAAVDKYGYTREEFLRMTITDIRPQEDVSRLLEDVSKLRPTLQHAGQWRHRLKDGTIIDVEITSHTLRIDQHEAALVVAQDITERKRAEEQTQLQLHRLKALRVIDIAISSSFDLHLTLNILLDQVITQLNVDAAAILLFQPITKTLIHGASRGFRTTNIRESRVRLGEGYAGRAVLERRTIHIPNLTEAGSELTRALLINSEDFVDYYGVPLIVKGEVQGVLEIFHRSTLIGDTEWLDFLETLAGQAAIAVENATLFKNLQHSNQELFQAYDATIEGWSHALDLRDKETEGHTQRVTELTLVLARKFGFTEEQLINIRWGALLHDIGKMGVPDNILLKPDKLTDEEWEIMKKHPVFALEMLSPIAYLKSSIDIPYYHHEKWDGTGYPGGLKGDTIPLAARLFAVVDVWDALRSDRPYRNGWTVEETTEYIRAQAGSHFDPRVVEKFLEIIDVQMGNRDFQLRTRHT